MLCLWAAVRLQVLPTLLTENLSQANLVLTRLQWTRLTVFPTEILLLNLQTVLLLLWCTLAVSVRNLFYGQAMNFHSLKWTTLFQQAHLLCRKRKILTLRNLFAVRQVVFTVILWACLLQWKVFRLHTTRICRKIKSLFLTVLIQLNFACLYSAIWLQQWQLKRIIC